MSAAISAHTRAFIFGSAPERAERGIVRAGADPAPNAEGSGLPGRTGWPIACSFRNA